MSSSTGMTSTGAKRPADVVVGDDGRNVRPNTGNLRVAVAGAAAASHAEARCDVCGGVMQSPWGCAVCANAETIPCSVCGKGVLVHDPPSMTCTPCAAVFCDKHRPLMTESSGIVCTKCTAKNAAAQKMCMTCSAFTTEGGFTCKGCNQFTCERCKLKHPGFCGSCKGPCELCTNIVDVPQGADTKLCAKCMSAGGAAGGAPVEVAASSEAASAGGGDPRDPLIFGAASFGKPEYTECNFCEKSAAICVMGDNGTVHLCTKCEKDRVRQCAFCNDKVVMDAEDIQMCRGCGSALCVKHRSDTEGDFGFPLCHTKRFDSDGKLACAGFVPCPWPRCDMPVMGMDGDGAGDGCPGDAFYACGRHSCSDIFCNNHQSGDTLDENGDKMVTAVPCPHSRCAK